MTEKERTLIEEACQYLKDHIDPDLVIYHDKTWTRLDAFILRFKRHLENNCK